MLNLIYCSDIVELNSRSCSKISIGTVNMIDTQAFEKVALSLSATGLPKLDIMRLELFLTCIPFFL